MASRPAALPAFALASALAACAAFAPSPALAQAPLGRAFDGRGSFERGSFGQPLLQPGQGSTCRSGYASYCGLPGAAPLGRPCTCPDGGLGTVVF